MSERIRLIEGEQKGDRRLGRIDRYCFIRKNPTGFKVKAEKPSNNGDQQAADEWNKMLEKSDETAVESRLSVDKGRKSGSIRYRNLGALKIIFHHRQAIFQAHIWREKWMRTTGATVKGES